MKVISYLTGRPSHAGMTELVKRSPNFFCLAEPGYDVVYTRDKHIADAYAELGVDVFGMPEEEIVEEERVVSTKSKKSKERVDEVYPQGDSLDDDGL